MARHAGVSRDALYDRLDALLNYVVLQEVDVNMQRTNYVLNQDAPATNTLAKLLYPKGDTDN